MILKKKAIFLLLLAVMVGSYGFIAITADDTAEASWEGGKALGDVVSQFTYPVGERWRDMVFIGDAMYAIQINEANIYEVDPTDGTILNTLAVVGATAQIGLAYDGEAFWIDNYDTDTIYRIDRYDGTVLNSFASPASTPYGLTWDGSNLWNYDSDDYTLYKLNPTTGAVEDSFVIPTATGFVRGLAFDGQLIWYASEEDDMAYGLDPDTGATVTTFALSSATFYVGMGWDREYLWIAGQENKATTTAFQIDIERESCLEGTDCDDSNVCTDDACEGVGTTVDRIFHEPASDFTGTDRTRGNLYACTIDTTLTGVKMFLGLAANSDLTLGVYEADAAAGPYDLIFQQTESFTGPGTAWFTIDGVTVELLAGKFYAIVFAWQGYSVTYYTPDLGANDLPVSFGHIIGNTWPNTYLPDPNPSIIEPSTMVYQQELLTDAAGWCEHTNNTASCDDGEFCTDPDTCAAGVCVAGPARDCDDGLFCTGTESCNEATDVCDSSGDPCDVDEVCNEDTDTCDPLTDDDTIDDDVVDDDVVDDDVVDDDVADDDVADDDVADDDVADDDVADDDVAGDDDDDDDDSCCGC